MGGAVCGAAAGGWDVFIRLPTPICSSISARGYVPRAYMYLGLHVTTLKGSVAPGTRDSVVPMGDTGTQETYMVQLGRWKDAMVDG